MADRVFSIDLGSSYTKVCLRAAADSAVRPLAFPRLRDELKMCIPSAVVVDRSSNKATCGPAADGRTPGPTIEVHQNWKRRLFAGADDGTGPEPPPPPGPADPLPGFLASEPLRKLAAQSGIPAARLDQLSAFVTAAYGLTGVDPAAPARPATVKPAPAAVTPVDKVAVAFFSYLRGAMLEAATRQGVPTPDDIPVQVCVPALGPDSPAALNGSPAVRQLRKCVEKAGWTFHPDGGVLTEPYANAIGVLTRGTNPVLASGRLGIRQMFDGGPLYTVLKDSKTHPVYRSLVVDVGSFTTDFAAVTLDTAGDTVYDSLDLFRVTARSVPFGVLDLDAAVLEVLPADAIKFLKVQSQTDWHDFRVTVYTDGRSISTGSAGDIPGRFEASAVRAAIDRFAQRVHAKTAEFCRGLDPAHPQAMQEVVLTGGGNNIPAVRQAVRDGAAAGGLTATRVHWSGPTSTQASPPVKEIKDYLVRGGSAVGGASIYFDKAFW